MSAGICCIHCHIYRSSHTEVFFKKGVLRIFKQFTGEHPCKSVTSVILKSHFCMGILNMLQICSGTPFLENTSGELLLYIILNGDVINVQVLSKQVKDCLEYNSIL